MTHPYGTPIQGSASFAIGGQGHARRFAQPAGATPSWIQQVDADATT